MNPFNTPAPTITQSDNVQINLGVVKQKYIVLITLIRVSTAVWRLIGNVGFGGSCISKHAELRWNLVPHRLFSVAVVKSGHFCTFELTGSQWIPVGWGIGTWWQKQQLKLIVIYFQNKLESEEGCCFVLFCFVCSTDSQYLNKSEPNLTTSCQALDSWDFRLNHKLSLFNKLK